MSEEKEDPGRWLIGKSREKLEEHLISDSVRHLSRDLLDTQSYILELEEENAALVKALAEAEALRDMEYDRGCSAELELKRVMKELETYKGSEGDDT